VVTLLLASNALAGTGNPMTTNTVLSSEPVQESFQGYLTNAEGQPIEGNVKLTIRLYSEPSGGKALWMETHTNVPVTNGLFRVYLGSKETLTQALLSQPLWLGISVNDDAEMTPRELFDSGAARIVPGMPRLLGVKTCEYPDCGEPTINDVDGWGGAKGNDSNDDIEVTATTQGGPVVVHMTARFNTNPERATYCRIQVMQNGEQIKRTHQDGSSTFATADQGCSGTYVFADLEPGTYTFRAGAYFHGTTDVTWRFNRQIAVFEY
jgi:hypothetical protein